VKIKYSFVCDSAVVGMNGNLSAMNIFQNLGATQFPVTIPKMVFVAVIQFHRSEIGVHKFRLALVDDDGRDVIPPMAGEINATMQSLNVNMLTEMVGINVARAGVYQLDLTIDNNHMTSEQITVAQMNAPPKQ
jgi:hypothetical protein